MADIESRIAGALIAGSSLLTAQAILAELAQGGSMAGSPENIAALQHAATALPVGAPLTRAHQRAIRRAIDGLRAEYPHTGNACTLLQSFDLVAACASSALSALPPAAFDVAGIRGALGADLNRLLVGHDEREIAFLQEHLLAAAARALRVELSSDPQARRSYLDRLAEGDMPTGRLTPLPWDEALNAWRQ